MLYSTAKLVYCQVFNWLVLDVAVQFTETILLYQRSHNSNIGQHVGDLSFVFHQLKNPDNRQCFCGSHLVYI